MTTTAEDILTILNEAGFGDRRVILFTPADKGAYDNRPLTVVASEARTSEDLDVTVQADRSAVNLLFSGQYGPNGEASVEAFARKVYKYIRNSGEAPYCILDKVVNGHTYLCIKARHPPSHEGYDQDGRTVYSFEIDIYRVTED